MNSFISWVGGNNYLKKEIVKRFPKKFNKYVEVFGGAVWVLFYKKETLEEVYNDYNSELVNLFKCVKYHTPELQRELSDSLNSRQLFNEMKSSYNIEGLTDIQRSARFFMLIKTSYGSNLKDFGCIKRDINRMTDNLNKVQERLNNVVIENRDYERQIKTYDRKETLFYLDPPYYGTEKYYQVKFGEEDHMRLYNTLKNIKGKFMLLYNDCEHIRNLYNRYKIERVERVNNLTAKYNKGNKYGELIIRNY